MSTTKNVSKTTIIMQVVLAVIFTLVILIGIVAGITGSGSDPAEPSYQDTDYQTDSPF